MQQYCKVQDDKYGFAYCSRVARFCERAANLVKRRMPFVILVISYFDFIDGGLVLIVPVPGHCSRITFCLILCI